MTPLQMLRHHVTGAIERGEATAITELRRPMASAQREIIGAGVLQETRVVVNLIAIANDLATGSPFYIVDGPQPFGVWPDELEKVTWAMPV